MAFLDIPVWILMPAFVLLFVAGSWMILLVMRRWVLRASRGSGEWDRVLGYAMAAYGVFYGVTLAMIAAGSYQNYSEVDGAVLQESSSVAVLYRDATGFPPDTAAEMHRLLVAYAEHVVHDDWPQQAQGILPDDTVAEVASFERLLFSFQPQNQAQVSLQAETIGAFNTFVGDRRARIAVTDLSLPAVLWVVLGVGAVLNAVLIALIEVRRIRVHLIMSALISVFVALLIFAIASFDHPYAGPAAVQPQYFEALLAGLLSGGG